MLDTATKSPHPPPEKVTGSGPTHPTIRTSRKTSQFNKPESHTSNDDADAAYFSKYLKRGENETIDDWFYSDRADYDVAKYELCKKAYESAQLKVATENGQGKRDLWCTILGKPVGAKSSGKLMKRELTVFIMDNLDKIPFKVSYP
jgi:hypothetical protein